MHANGASVCFVGCLAGWLAVCVGVTIHRLRCSRPPTPLFPLPLPSQSGRGWLAYQKRKSSGPSFWRVAPTHPISNSLFLRGTDENVYLGMYWGTYRPSCVRGVCSFEASPQWKAVEDPRRQIPCRQVTRMQVRAGCLFFCLSSGLRTGTKVASRCPRLRLWTNGPAQW